MNTKLVQTQIIRRLSPALLVVALLATACQTWDENAKDDPEVSAINSQKVIVVNYLNSGQPDHALKDLRPLLLKHPDDYELNNLMGLTQMALHNYERALADFRKAYAQKPAIVVGLNMSSALIETGHFKEATTLLFRLKKQSVGEYEFPERIDQNLGLVAEKQRHWAEAEKYYSLALQENPTFYMSLMALGSIYQQSKREPQAIEKFKLAKESCPACIEPIQHLVAIQLNLGRTEDAQRLVEAYARQEDLRPDDKKAAHELMKVFKRRPPKTARLP